MTELQSFGATERVAEYSDPLQIEASPEPARGVRRIQPFELIEREAHVGDPRPN